jgi:hypothetical protein
MLVQEAEEDKSDTKRQVEKVSVASMGPKLEILSQVEV